MLVLHVLATVATTAAALLGLWQYDVWQGGREASAGTVVDRPPVPLRSVLTADAAFPRTGVGTPVRLEGRWLPESTVYVTDRELRGRPGVWAVTPVAVCPPADDAGCADASAVLVARGWARSVVAAPSPPTGPVRLTGWLQPGDATGPPDPTSGDDVLPALRITDALAKVDRDLYSGYVISAATPPAGSGLEGLTPAALPRPPAFTAVRNLLYAIEWWVFGGFAVYVWARWCRDEVVREAEVPSQA